MTSASATERPVVSVRGARKSFHRGSELASFFAPAPVIRAVDDVTFDIHAGEIVGLVGESGSGKTTLGRLLVRLETLDAGAIVFGDGRDISRLRGRELRRLYRDVQMVFQDPYESINPRFTAYETVAEPLRAQRLTTRNSERARVTAALGRAGLRPPEALFEKYPHELSGGERQRLSIARALVLAPKLLVADEPVSMLDVSVRAGILNVLRGLSRDPGLGILYISHDLSTTRYLCDRIMIMYRGTVVEMGGAEELIGNPRHPYSQALRAAIPIPDPDTVRERLDARPSAPRHADDPRACRYLGRCPYAIAACETAPELRTIAPGHQVACHLQGGLTP
jgi:peptide/nickel transport system ATP-binding protein